MGIPSELFRIMKVFEHNPFLFSFAIKFGPEGTGIKKLCRNSKYCSMTEKRYTFTISSKSHAVGFSKLACLLGLDNGLGIRARSGAENDNSHKITFEESSLHGPEENIQASVDALCMLAMS